MTYIICFVVKPWNTSSIPAVWRLASDISHVRNLLVSRFLEVTIKNNGQERILPVIHTAGLSCWFSSLTSSSAFFMRFRRSSVSMARIDRLLLHGTSCSSHWAVQAAPLSQAGEYRCFRRNTPILSPSASYRLRLLSVGIVCGKWWIIPDLQV